MQKVEKLHRKLCEKTNEKREQQQQENRLSWCYDHHQLCIDLSKPLPENVADFDFK